MLLNQIITADTDIISLKENEVMSIDKSAAIIGCRNSNKNDMFYTHDGKDYIYKSELDCVIKEYPYTIFNEIIGSHLASYLKIPTVKYEIAYMADEYGLVSLNFKDGKHRYYYFDQLPIEGLVSNRNSLDNLHLLENSCTSYINQEQLRQEIMGLFILDFYMIQTDRVLRNVQFSIDCETNEIHLAPLYDYSICRPKFPNQNINYSFEQKNPIMDLNWNNMSALVRDYKQFLSLVQRVMNLNFDMIWNQITTTYHFDEESQVYQKMKLFYLEKDEAQKKIIRSIL